MKETLLRNNVHFVNEVPVIYLNFIVIIRVVYEKK